MLRTVAYGWQQETVAESARAVAKLGRELYDRLGIFAKHFSKIGRSLDTAVGSYNEAVGSFESRVLVSARKFSDHGITGDGELPAVRPVEHLTRHDRGRRSSTLRATTVVELPARAPPTPPSGSGNADGPSPSFTPVQGSLRRTL